MSSAGKGRLRVGLLVGLGAIMGSLASTAAPADDDAYECRKSYVTEFCTGTMMVALVKAQQEGGTPDLIAQMKREWETASAVYKGAVVFDDQSKKTILKASFDGFSIENVGGLYRSERRWVQIHRSEGVRILQDPLRGHGSDARPKLDRTVTRHEKEQGEVGCVVFWG